MERLTEKEIEKVGKFLKTEEIGADLIEGGEGDKQLRDDTGEEKGLQTEDDDFEKAEREEGDKIDNEL
jgi:hypothetical protein